MDICSLLYSLHIVINTDLFLLEKGDKIWLMLTTSEDLYSIAATNVFNLIAVEILT